jgi:hypothetical protein
MKLEKVTGYKLSTGKIVEDYDSAVKEQLEINFKSELYIFIGKHFDKNEDEMFDFIDENKKDLYNLLKPLFTSEEKPTVDKNFKPKGSLLLEQDGCAPNALTFFMKEFKEKVGITIKEFKSIATKKAGNDSTGWIYSDYILYFDFFEGYKLYHNTNKKLDKS